MRTEWEQQRLNFLGNLIRRRREDRGIDQGELATLIGVSQPTISAWELGRATPSVGYNSALERELDIDTDRVLSAPFAGVLTRDDRDPVKKAIVNEDRLSIDEQRALVIIYEAMLKSKT
jgi:transcriptional regulator with XRE-family HTH domain